MPKDVVCRHCGKPFTPMPGKPSDCSKVPRTFHDWRREPYLSFQTALSRVMIYQLVFMAVEFDSQVLIPETSANRYSRNVAFMKIREPTFREECASRHIGNRVP